MIDANKFLSEVDEPAKKFQKYLERHEGEANEEERELLTSIKEMQNSLKEAIQNQAAPSKKSGISEIEKVTQNNLEQDSSIPDLSERLSEELDRILKNIPQNDPNLSQPKEEELESEWENPFKDMEESDLKGTNIAESVHQESMIPNQESLQQSTTENSEKQIVANFFDELRKKAQPESKVSTHESNNITSEQVEQFIPQPQEQENYDKKGPNFDSGEIPLPKFITESNNDNEFLTKLNNAYSQNVDNILNGGKSQTRNAEELESKNIEPIPDMFEKENDLGIEYQFHTPNILGTAEREIPNNLEYSQQLFRNIQEIANKKTPQQIFSPNPNAFKNMSNMLMEDTISKEEKEPSFNLIEPLNVEAYADSIRRQDDEIQYQSENSQNDNWSQIMNIAGRIPTSQRNRTNLQKQRETKNEPSNSQQYVNLEMKETSDINKNGNKSQHLNDGNESIDSNFDIIFMNNVYKKEDIPTDITQSNWTEEKEVPVQLDNSNDIADKETPINDHLKSFEDSQLDTSKSDKKRPLSGFVTKVRKSWKNMSLKAKVSTGVMTVALILALAGYGNYRHEQKANNSKGPDNESNFETDNSSKTDLEEQVDKALEEQNGKENDMDKGTPASTTEQNEKADDIDKEVPTSTAEQNEEQSKNNNNQNYSELETDQALTSEALQPVEDVEQNSMIIGGTTQVNEDSRIYRDEYNAYLGENSSPAYYNHDENRVIVGVAIVDDNGMHQIYANDPDANYKINTLIQNGGELVSILTANKKYLPDYDGSDTLSIDEINAYAEGWYNINDIANANVKGIKR